MEREDQLQAAKFAQLRQDIQEGLRSGSAGELDVQSIKRRGRERLAAVKRRRGLALSRVTKTVRAEQDLKEICFYVALDNVTAADALLDEVESSCLLLAECAPLPTKR
jgi:hypothetical protein